MDTINVKGPSHIPAASAERIMRELPQWFGIESALMNYAQDAEVLANFVAVTGDLVVGFLTVREHNLVSLEISCIALVPSWHRLGLGRRLCEMAEDWWAERGGRLMHVKTLGPSRVNEHYARTRAFYDALGYIPLEEFPNLWSGNPCLLLVKPLGRGDSSNPRPMSAGQYASRG